MNVNLLQENLNSILSYRQGLPETDKSVFDKMLEYARIHAKEGGNSRFNVLETMLIGIVLEQQKEINCLKLALFH